MNSNLESHGKKFVDQYGNTFYTQEELSRGGQGVVYKTSDPDLAIKQPLNVEGKPDKTSNLMNTFRNIRLLSLPKGIALTLPLSIMKSEPGYVMRLLNAMQPFSSVFKTTPSLKCAQEDGIPDWLAEISDKKQACRLSMYAQTGGTRLRLDALFQCALTLARLHSAGILYGDVSPNNVFIGVEEKTSVWLIDADNMRLESLRGGKGIYTPKLGAPEILQGKDTSRPRTDCWAFAVMAFELLSMTHPFIGRKVQGDDGEGDDWDSEPSEDSSLPKDEQAYQGMFPFIDDENDDSNSAPGMGLPRELILTEPLKRLFQETFGPGRTKPFRRPSMAFWALELARAHDISLRCPNCGMSYYESMFQRCPYCQAPVPGYVMVETPRWKQCLQGPETHFRLPNRITAPFSLKHADDTECEVEVDFVQKKVQPVRGFQLPEGIAFEFRGNRK